MIGYVKKNMEYKVSNQYEVYPFIASQEMSRKYDYYCVQKTPSK